MRRFPALAVVPAVLLIAGCTDPLAPSGQRKTASGRALSALDPVTATYGTGDIAVAIPDMGSVDVPITVPDAGSVMNVKVAVRLNHTFDSDVTLSLVGPDGSVVLLSQERGGSGDNYGSGTNNCAGSPTRFDDAATTAIIFGSAPFDWTYTPESPLSALIGTPSNGTWKLRAADSGEGDIGTIGCVQVELTYQPADVVPPPDPNWFFAPISNTDLNAVYAGQMVPVKFSLGGDQGLNILAATSPVSKEIDCTTLAAVGPEQATASRSGLRYDPLADQYIYVWTTDKAWATTCRELNVTLADGSEHKARFSFR